MHKYIFQCTNVFFSTPIYFQCTNIFFGAQIYFPVHKYIFQCTIVYVSAQIIFSNAQIYFAVHQYIFQCTNIFISTLRRELSTVPAIYFKAVSVLVRITQQHFTSQSSNAKKKKLYSLLGVNLIAH